MLWWHVGNFKPRGRRMPSGWGLQEDKRAIKIETDRGGYTQEGSQAVDDGD